MSRSERRFYSATKAFGRLGMRLFPAQVMDAPHWHGHLEANFLTEGTLLYAVDGQKVRVPGGRLCVFWAGIPHQLLSVERVGGRRPRLGNIYIPLDSFLFMPHLARMQVEMLAGAMIALPETLCDWAMMERWYADYRSGRTERIEVVKMELNALFRRASMEPFDYLRRPPAQEAESSGLRSAHVRHVVAMVRHVLENWREPLRSAEVAAVTGLNPNYALGLFSRTMHLSLKKFIIRMRLIRARAMLMESNDAISTVAVESGFTSMSQFYLHFRKAYGDTPYQLRQNYLEATLAGS